MNSGGVRGSLFFAKSPPATGETVDGQVRYTEAFTVQPFGNTLVVKTCTGQQIYDVLNQQYNNPEPGANRIMPTDEYADFLYAAVLRDWGAERERMQRYADRFDAAEQVRIVGEGTDLTLSIAGRSMKVDAGGANIPGGEFFCSPVEDSAEGEITFAEFPAVLTGRDVVGVHLRFENGKVVDASADVNEDFLIQTLDTDEGARFLGELGIGCNPGITKHTRNILFDEKIDGTVHLALGNGIHDIGGTNVSAIHWDIVKDLRPGGRIELDGELVQENGRWLI